MLVHELVHGGHRIRVARDDLYPLAGGGNKGRKLERIFAELPAECQAIITTGSTQSNHARVCALLAAQRGIEAHLVLHGPSRELAAPEGNLLVALLAGANVQVVAADRIATTIDGIHRALQERGVVVRVIPGGGHCLAGGLAYADAVDELTVLPDVIVLASGTGATQAGLLAGLDRRQAETRVIGVSVARRQREGRPRVLESYRELRGHLGLASPERQVEFDDRWRFGGYGDTRPELLDTIVGVARTTGLVLDPTYTGKAFFALLGMLRSGEIARQASVLFWHTGGLLNALASADLKEAMKRV
ncbi:1-aminocyclopropane-1-carboxylate deaminase/D-cysteine desulfhydrase [Billgrantia lactosivorans]|uniref:1-aminocyclopropane-1-carboxylate deaminase/D-cysteine desulfhydrase n=1 Tax=Billgrantia lactosivorans TaxID=2185141 RepID=UPI0013A6CBB1|nr:pyridoxal-phosphate dependent enzyme [Halomonas lactosivorans]